MGLFTHVVLGAEVNKDDIFEVRTDEKEARCGAGCRKPEGAGTYCTHHGSVFRAVAREELTELGRLWDAKFRIRPDEVLYWDRIITRARDTRHFFTNSIDPDFAVVGIELGQAKLEKDYHRSLDIGSGYEQYANRSRVLAVLRSFGLEGRTVRVYLV